MTPPQTIPKITELGVTSRYGAWLLGAGIKAW
jgi:hypothetical protein